MAGIYTFPVAKERNIRKVRLDPRCHRAQGDLGHSIERPISGNGWQ